MPTYAPFPSQYRHADSLVAGDRVLLYRRGANPDDAVSVPTSLFGGGGGGGVTSINGETGVVTGYMKLAGTQTVTGAKRFDAVVLFGGTDTALARNAAGVLEVNNGTPGTFRDIKTRTVLANPTDGTGPAANSEYFIANSSGAGIGSLSGGVGAHTGLGLFSNSVCAMALNSAQSAINWKGDFVVGFSSGNPSGGNADTAFARAAAGVMEVNTGVAGTLAKIVHESFRFVSGSYMFGSDADALSANYASSSLGLDSNLGGVYLGSGMGVHWSAHATLNNFDRDLKLERAAAGTVNISNGSGVRVKLGDVADGNSFSGGGEWLIGNDITGTPWAGLATYSGGLGKKNLVVISNAVAAFGLFSEALQVMIKSDHILGWSTSVPSAHTDTGFSRAAAGIVQINTGHGASGAGLNFIETTADADIAAPSSGFTIFSKQVGGKNAFFVRFPTGAVQQLAIEP